MRVYKETYFISMYYISLLQRIVIIATDSGCYGFKLNDIEVADMKDAAMKMQMKVRLAYCPLRFPFIWIYLKRSLEFTPKLLNIPNVD